MTEGVLGEIVRRKRLDVAARLRGATMDAKPTRRSLRAALGRTGASIIMEVKTASPSGHRSAVSVETAAAAYAPVADAISVLTDGPFFGGSLEDLRSVRRHFDGPILAKDFIVDPVQVAEARAHGADAVLAILAVLSDAEAATVLAEARRLSMDVLVEVHDAAEVGRAIALGATTIGINNRDLGTLTTDLRVTERLAPLVPDNRVLVSESGIAARADVERLAPLVDAFLVGSSLMACDDITHAARRLAFGTVKLCGLTRAEDVRLAAAAGASHAGFVFAPGTPRTIVAPDEPVAEARRLGLRAIGVFRDQDPVTIARTAAELELDAVQLHGRENGLAELRAKLPQQCEIWALAAVGEHADPARASADRTVFDTCVDGTSGGTGRAFDWTLVAGRPDLANGFLAGGIGPDNARAAQSVGAYGLDVGSKVEIEPGRKHPQRVRALFAALRPDCRHLQRCS